MATQLPKTYAEWRHCITVDCGIELTTQFIEARLRALGDPADSHTARFVELYGEGHRDQVIEWFELARTEPAAGTSR